MSLASLRNCVMIDLVIVMSYLSVLTIGLPAVLQYFCVSFVSSIMSLLCFVDIDGEVILRISSCSSSIY